MTFTSQLSIMLGTLLDRLLSRATTSESVARVLRDELPSDSIFQTVAIIASQRIARMHDPLAHPAYAC